MIDFSKLNLKSKGSKKTRQQFDEDHDLVKALQNAEAQHKRLSYRAFAVLAHAAGETSGPKFTPLCFGLLNRMPGGLDALVCRANGTQPNSKHAEHPANAEEWAVIDSSEELKGIVDPVYVQFHFLKNKIEGVEEGVNAASKILGDTVPNPLTKEDVVQDLLQFKEDPESMGAAEPRYRNWTDAQFDALIELVSTL